MRFYKNTLPSVGDTVMLRVEQVDELGVRGILVEYGELEAYARIQDMKRTKSVRSLNHITQVGHLEVVQVTDIETDGSVIVNRNMIRTPQKEEFQLFYSKAKQVNSVLSYVSNLHKIHDLGDLLGWPSHKELFDMISQKFEGFGLDDTVASTLIKECSKKLRNDDDEIKSVRVFVDMMCVGKDGICAIQHAIRAGEATHPSIRVYFFNSPRYVVVSTTISEGQTLCMNAITAMTETLHGFPGGKLSISIKTKKAIDAGFVYANTDFSYVK